MSPVRKPRPAPPPREVLVTFAAEDDEAWERAIEQWLLSLLLKPPANPDDRR